VSTFYKNSYGGRMPIGSLRLEKKQKRKRRLKYVTKLMFLGGALGLILIAALRFTSVGASGVNQAIMNCYYLFFGIVAALT
jgi:membrane associated rhomboid family serine protease